MSNDIESETAHGVSQVFVATKLDSDAWVICLKKCGMNLLVVDPSEPLAAEFLPCVKEWAVSAVLVPAVRRPLFQR